ncbi:MAG: zinc ribbon domain-containing protein [Anaerolineales bacterium]|nr:zinc ribbon domain-containing protein [Anaerolineales bacterium]
MKSVWKWILLGIAVFVVAFLIALPLWAGFPMASGEPIYGYGMMSRGMLNWGMGGIWWIGMLFRLAVPILVIGGVAALVYWLAKRPSAPPPAATVPCEYCGKPLDPGWVACPHCGKKKK